VEAIVARMLDPEPGRRYPTYASLLSDIRKTQSTLKPLPSGAFGPVAKKGGRIVLTKRRGGGLITPPPASSGPLTIHAGHSGVGASPSLAALSEEKPRMKRGLKIGLIVGGSVLGLLLAAGGTTWGLFHHKKVTAERLASEKENSLLARTRASAEAAWSTLVTLTSNTALRAQATKPWMTDLDMAASAIFSSTNKLTDLNLIAEAETNTTALVQLVSQSATGTLAGLLVELQAITNAAGTNLVSLIATTNSIQAEQVLAAITNLPAQALLITESFKVEADRAEVAFKDLLALKKRISEAAAGQAAAAEREAKERAEAEQKAREEAAAQREAAEKERQLQAEVRLVQDLRKNNSPQIQQNHFKQAGEALAALEKGLKTDPGKEAWKLTSERYKMMEGLKTFIIEGVAAEAKANPATGYKFGWLNSKDILAADEDKVTVRGGTIPWDQVPPAQMVRFIRHYVGSPELPRREAARQNLAAAVYVFEAGNGNEAARKLATEFTGEALRANPSLDAQIKAFFPENTEGQ
jgi:hypothetical protein